MMHADYTTIHRTRSPPREWPPLNAEADERGRYIHNMQTDLPRNIPIG